MRSRYWFLLASSLVLIDQAAKLAIRGHFAVGERLPLSGFFNLTLLYNPGAAFSFLADAGGWQKGVFTFLGFGVSVWIAIMLCRHPEKTLQNHALALVMGGAIGNVIDRIAYGAVVDFLDFHVSGWHWPAFNIADAGITAGAILLFIATAQEQRAEKPGIETR
ncbi:MAG: signal peptidase II [Zoogloeaceae bacterium]|nr:signal peptidase II [Zoogloeaceae bacterium]